MLSTELSYLFGALCVLAVVFCLFIYVWVLRLANFTRDAVAFVQNENKRAVSLRRITDLDVAVTELTDSYNALYESNKKLRARIGMRDARQKRKNGADSGSVPSNEADKADFKARLRENALQRGLLK